MTECPVCDGYYSALQLEIDKAGEGHRAAMEEIRRKEAAGEPLEPLRDFNPWFRHQSTVID